MTLYFRKILELGSGIGLLGITIVKLLQPQKYLFSDKSLDVLNILSKNCEINLETNVMKEVIENHQLLWGAIDPNDAIKLAPSIVLGAGKFKMHIFASSYVNRKCD